MTRKDYSTFCLSLLFWLLAAWGMTWSRTGKVVTDFVPEEGLGAAALLVVVGLFVYKFAARVAGDEGGVGARRFALIIMVAGVLGGLITIALEF